MAPCRQVHDNRAAHEAILPQVCGPMKVTCVLCQDLSIPRSHDGVALPRSSSVV